MKYTYVEGKSKKEALQKVRKIYGEDAFIYEESERPVKNIFGKLFNKKEYVIRIGLSEKSVRPRNESLRQLEEMLRKKSESQKNLEAVSASLSKSQNRNYTSILSKSVHSPNDNNKMGTNLLSLPENYENNNQQNQALITQNILPNNNNEVSLKENKIHPNTDSEFNLLKKDVKDILEHLKEIKQNPESPVSDFAAIVSMLQEQMFSEIWINDFMDSYKRDIPQNEWKNKKILEKKLNDLLSLRIKTASSLHSKKIITLIGPTGSGKTTTIAKLAKKIKFDHSMSLLLVTMDNYRIAATEQLKVYGNIMDIPVQMVKNKEEFEALLNESQYDRILIDTPGFSPANENLMEKLHDTIKNYSNSIDKHLVLPANMKKDDILRNLERFSLLKTDKIILSKLDETRTIGYFLELSEEWNYPFSFITNGQRVPEDIMDAEKRFMAEFIAKKIRWEK